MTIEEKDEYVQNQLLPRYPRTGFLRLRRLIALDSLLVEDDIYKVFLLDAFRFFNLKFFGDSVQVILTFGAQFENVVHEKKN